MGQTVETIRACYDAIAVEYANVFGDGLSKKPMDREMLERFAHDLLGSFIFST